MLDYRGWFVLPITPARGLLLISSVTQYAYDAADIMYNDNFVTVMESYVIILLLQVAKVNTKMAPSIDHLVLEKK